jgi:hypothetical protein
MTSSQTETLDSIAESLYSIAKSLHRIAGALDNDIDKTGTPKLSDSIESIAEALEKLQQDYDSTLRTG